MTNFEDELEITFEPEPQICKEGGSGLLLPLVPNEHEWNQYGRAALYLIFLVWCFKGVEIVSDIFMEAIEKVTSKRARKFNPVTKSFVTVFVWNPTVANLSLMALGSSAPEILLSVIELLGNDFYAGSLGPSTIVGSAAFNLFCIIAVCVMTIPRDEVRKIKETRVYMITSFFSVFAYLWLLVILMGTSENVVEPWEGIVTFLFFPVLLILAYMADKGMFGGDKATTRGSVISAEMSKEELKAMEEDIRKRQGGANMSEEMVRTIMKIEAAEPSSIAQYRKKVRNKASHAKNGLPMPGAPDAKPPTTDPAKIVPFDEDDEIPDPKVSYVTFSFMLRTKAVLEDIGKVEVVVQREGLMDRACSVAFKTKDGPAKAPEDYKHVEGRLQFAAGATEQSIWIEIVDDDKYKENQEFYVELMNPEVQSNEKGKHRGALGDCSSMTIKIIDNDVPGVLAFDKDTIDISETPGEDKEFEMIVKRKDGATGKVSCKYRSEGDSAQSGEDFDEVSGTLEFENGECEKKITCTIKGKTRHEAEQLFRMILEEPEGGAKFDSRTDGGEDSCICTIIIHSDIAPVGGIQKITSTVALRWDKAKTGNANWAAQFTDALFTVFEDEDEDDGDPDQEKVRGCGETVQAYLMYVICLPWKLLFACIPPTDYCGGWVCFFSALVMVGAVTAVIGDVAAIFGCCLSVPDAVTAITFVALGTSLPDTFASKKAAEEDPFADASVGNVTGSNSVNVFLGLGLPWSIGAIYWTLGTTPKWRALFASDPEVPEAFRTGAFVVKAGDLGISVAVFSGCALICIAVLAARRKAFGGELGGPYVPKVATSTLLVCLWLIYISISSWNSIRMMNQ